jgi:hypothetical protein
MSSFTFPDPPEVALQLAARLLSTLTASPNATRDDDDRIGVPDRITGNAMNDDEVAGNNQQQQSDEGGRDTYEFVAFLLWYLFLVICCVLPTCCAYRRRRLVENRMAQQQASFDRLRQQNVFILSHLQQHVAEHGMSVEEIKAERTRRITEELQETTFVSIMYRCRSIRWSGERHFAYPLFPRFLDIIILL